MICDGTAAGTLLAAAARRARRDAVRAARRAHAELQALAALREAGAGQGGGRRGRGAGAARAGLAACFRSGSPASRATSRPATRSRSSATARWWARGSSTTRPPSSAAIKGMKTAEVLELLPQRRRGGRPPRPLRADLMRVLKSVRDLAWNGVRATCTSPPTGYTGGRVGGTFRGVQTLLLDHVGRRSGKHRTHPLLYIADGDDLVIVASRGGSHRHPALVAEPARQPADDGQVDHGLSRPSRERSSRIVGSGGDGARRALWSASSSRRIPRWATNGEL